jgi:excisionase family DNA binding protein
MTKHYITTREAAKLIGVSSRTVYRAIERGLIKDIKHIKDRKSTQPKYLVADTDPWLKILAETKKQVNYDF